MTFSFELWIISGSPIPQAARAATGAQVLYFFRMFEILGFNFWTACRVVAR